MNVTILLWVGFIAFVLLLLAIDLGVFHRRSHEVGLREAAIWSSVWIALALLFNAGIFLWMGEEKGLEFLTGYLLEKSLSMDNIFVFLVIFANFGVPAIYQHRVLFYGILGAMIMRGAFIATGVTLLNMFHWVVYGFGGFLVLTGIRLALRKDQEIDPERNPVLRVARRFFPITTSYHGQSFVIRRQGALMVTPLLLVLLVVESTDLVFAIDSVPAVLAVTRDPFIVFTSNIFAILGLRALYFLMANVLQRMRYLKAGLSVVLVFVGVKILITEVYQVPTMLSLGAIATILAVTITASYMANEKDARPKQVHSAAQGSAPSQP